MPRILTILLLTALRMPQVSGQAIDVHSHIILPKYIEVLAAHYAELEETFPLPDIGTAIKEAIYPFDTLNARQC